MSGPENGHGPEGEPSKDSGQGAGEGGCCGGEVGGHEGRAASGGGGEGNGEAGNLVGGLILRGNRCVLVRSLDGEWEGMRIPWLAAEPGENGPATALRSVVEFCEIEEDEVHVLDGLLPVSLSVPGLPPISVYALYAKNAPPGALEDADQEDPEDLYDWYTFPRAMDALAHDPYARATLATMALTLAVGSAADRVPGEQWGGIFGQEWAAGALGSIKGAAGKARPVKLEKSGCTIGALCIASNAAASAHAAANGGPGSSAASAGVKRGNEQADVASERSVRSKSG